MSDDERDGSDRPAGVKTGRIAYEPPRIVWREPYEPVSFGVSCAHEPGNPGCNPGPFTA
jgi:hypothetical protein